MVSEFLPGVNMFLIITLLVSVVVTEGGPCKKTGTALVLCAGPDITTFPSVSAEVKAM